MNDQARAASAGLDRPGLRLQQALGGTAGAWLSLWLVDLALASQPTGGVALLQAAGVLALYCLGSMVALVVVGAALARLLPTPDSGVARMGRPELRDSVWVAVVSLLLAAISYVPMRHACAALLPADLAQVDRIRDLAGTWAAVGGGVLVSAAVWMVRRVPRPYPRAVCGLLLLALALATRADYQAISNGREWLLLIMCAPALVFCFMDLGGRAVERVLLPAGLAMLVSIGLLFLLLSTRPAARAELVQAHAGSAELLRLALTVFDLDGDGYPGAPHGADCDDDNPDIHPAALEFAGNGIDDNCSGGDLPRFESRPPAYDMHPQAPRNVLMISIDALRADMLPSAPPPAQADPMPNLRRLASRGAHFLRAYVQATSTGVSLPSIMTGTWPMNFNGPRGEWLGSEPSLASRLAERGYHTLVVHQVWLQDPFTGAALDPKGWAPYAGFSHVDDSLAPHNRDFRGKTSDATSARLIAHLMQQQSKPTPFLTWTHYMDPHEEYLPREGTPFAGDTLRDRYLQEVHATDRALGAVFAHLERTRFLDTGLLVIFSDHGELVDDRGRSGHARWVEEDVLRGVLVVVGAGVPATVVNTRVRMIDVLPTVMELAAGVHVSGDGRSLTETWRAGAGPLASKDRDVFVQNTYGGQDTLVALVDDHKLVQSAQHGVRYLYDLRSDPQEQVNLIEREPARARALGQILGNTSDRAMNAALLTARVAAEAEASARESR